MPTISIPKEKLEGFPQLAPGRYQVMLESFAPKKAKSGTSINLNAALVVINHPTANGAKIFNNANTTFPPACYDMAHGLGQKFTGEDTDTDPTIPGEFICKVHGPTCDSSDPENWIYQGPLTQQVGEVEIGLGDDGKGGQSAKLKRFFCRVPGCTAKHSESLL